MKTAVSIPNDVFEAAEQRARKLHISRSQLYTRALEGLLKECRDAELTEVFNRVYSTEDSSLDPVIAELQARTLMRELGEDEW